MSKGGKILVVDDHVDLAENIAEILQSAGYEAVIADSAEAALRILKAGGIGALITDFKLPGRNGAELIAEIRRMGSTIPAVVMSAYSDETTIESSQDAGALEVLAKPVNIGRLMAVADALGREDTVVLVLDDNHSLAANIADALRSRGYEARIATTAAEALGGLERPRAAIIDYRLPDATGVQVAERLSTRDPRIQILFVSAHPDELRARLTGRFATSEAMEKPVDVSQLLSWVESALTFAKRTT